MFLLRLRIRPKSTRFPYTTLFRSAERPERRVDGEAARAARELRRPVDLVAHGPLVLALDEVRGLHRHRRAMRDRKSTRLNSSHVRISYSVFCWKKNNAMNNNDSTF